MTLLTSQFLDPNSKIQPGDIQFFDAIEPPLLSGSYTLSATQKIEGVVNENGSTPAPYITNKDFSVQGPQFSIGNTVVHTQYPAPLAIGNYGNDLPNVVLTDMSLPWSRPIDPLNVEENPNVPWMGLLTIYPDEMQPDATEINATNKVLGPKSVTVRDLVTPGNNTLGPALDVNNIGISPDTKVTVVDIDFTTFQNIAPKLEELPFLAHGRAVNTDGKVMLGMEGDGYFSLLIGNRLPKSGTPGVPAVNNIFLVSFEGFSSYLRGGSPAPTGIDKIRLVLLNAWNFKATAEGGSFLNLINNLCNVGGGGVQLMQMPGANTDIADPTAKMALQIGYTALQNNMRAGETATSWYRGPLVPSPTIRVDFPAPAGNTYLYSDNAIHYDPNTGIFNHSYSAAWQIGRLLALSDGSFANGFFDWRNAYINNVNRQAAQSTIQSNVAKMSLGDEQESTTLLQGVRSLFSNQIKDVEWPQIESREKNMLGEHLPGVLTEEEKMDIVNNDEDPLLALLNK